MNGGVVHAIEALEPTELADAIAGFRYFGLPAVAEILAESPDDSEETEERLDSAYAEEVPDDSTLVDAFRLRLARFPDTFAP
jgi:hypothetical protein